MEFSKFVEWTFYAVIGGVSVYGVRILSDLSTSIDALNVKIAMLLERSVFHEKILDRHEQELQQLREK